MTAPRSRKENTTYNRYQAKQQGSLCVFCEINKKSPQFVTEGKYFKVIRNIFAYSLWDSQDVNDHLMLVPKKHVDSLAKLPSAAATEYVKLISDYEQKGYNIYARAPVSVIKTVVHQHTHFIKTSGAPKRFVFLLRKPYVRLVLK